MHKSDDIISNISRKPFSLKQFLKEHQIGLLGTLAFHMILLMIFLLVKINNYKEINSLDLVFDFEEELTPEEIAKIQEEKEKDAYFEKLLEQQLRLSNRAVNEAKLEEELSTAKYVEDFMKQLNEQKSEDEKLKENILNEYLNQEDIVLQNQELPEEKAEFKGPTNISYEFLEEPRNRVSVNLPVPVYKCKGLGVVEVVISVDRLGNVITAKAKVIGASEDPECLAEVAARYAKMSVFRGNSIAPSEHKAKITYRFVAQ